MSSLPNTSETNRPIIVLLGPTASGKTDMSLKLAQSLPGGGECVIADSMQIYRGMDIGTASPSVQEQSLVPHHLLDVADPHEEGYTVAQWCSDAETAIAEIRSRSRWPIVVGGTSLYIRALLEGVFQGPMADRGIRAELEKLSIQELRVQLESGDPEAAARIHPNDTRRSIRALEVLALTGKRISEQQSQWGQHMSSREDALLTGLNWPTDELNRRINARVRLMLQNGFLEEVRGLLQNGGLGSQASEAVGYRELSSAIAGECTIEDATEAIKIRTRRFAKQQRTWLRRFQTIPDSFWLDAQGASSSDLAAKTTEWITQITT